MAKTKTASRRAKQTRRRSLSDLHRSERSDENGVEGSASQAMAARRAFCGDAQTFVVNEMFHSIQGEGVLVGVPAVFVRLAGCVNRCPWCDTRRAWAKDAGVAMTIGEIVVCVEPIECGHVVLTGGEPMIHEGVENLVDAMRERDRHVTVETSAVIYRRVRCDLLSISPKLPELLYCGQKAKRTASTKTGSARKSAGEKGPASNHVTFRPKIIAKMIDDVERFGGDWQLKFVVRNEADVIASLAACRTIGVGDRSRILLMPQSTSAARYATMAVQVAALAKRYDLRFGPRLHLALGVR